MRTSTTVTARRMVTGFNRVILSAQHESELIITQGSHEALTIEGPARFNASGLESHEAEVTVKGMGAAVVWATRDLAVAVRGPGQVSYYGAPRLSGSVTPLGSLVSLGGHARLSEVPEGAAGSAG